jgi:alpha-L-fucosidase
MRAVAYGAAVLAAGGVSARAAAGSFPIAPGLATPELETLRHYECPEWFRDAKFGIRTQWGPQSVPEMGDDYVRNFAIPGRRQNEYHVSYFGPPAEVGYDAVVARWTAERFDPDALVKRFAAAGAKYVITLGADRDNFDLWNSSHRATNAMKLGPKRDIVGAWSAAVRASGLRFGISEHPAPDTATETAKVWYDRLHELVDLHRPDVFYMVGALPSEEAGRSLTAHLYTRSIQWHQDLTAVYAARAASDPEISEIGVVTIERGSQSAVASNPWQCDTALNDWVYDRDAPMRPATAVIHELADIVSKNGNLLLNVPLRADGSLPDDAGVVLDEIGAWLTLNGEAVYGTRPWLVSGEGPTETIGGPLGENKTLPYTPEDIRYTHKAWLNDDGKPCESIYAILLGWPGGGEEVVLGALAAGPKARAIGTVRLLGHSGALRVVRDNDGLHILLPVEAPCRHAVVFRID